jgi:cytochrome P450
MSLLRHFPWLDKGARTIPPHLLAPFSPVVAQFWREKMAITTQAREVMQAGSNGTETADHRTIFHDILNSKLPPQEKNLKRLAQEAQILLSAGTLATSWIMTVGCYHLLVPENAEYLNKLHSELRDAIPDPFAVGAFDLNKLEHLPYLAACINEMMRLGNGTTTRLQRIAPAETLKFTDSKTGKLYPIPPGTPMSISNFLVHRNPEYFPDPSRFNPNRWLEDPKLVKYLVAYSKGSRQCIGMHLANAEMYLTTARLFRNYVSVPLRDANKDSSIGSLELYDTAERDVVIVADLLIPAVFKGSKGVRLKVVN